MPKTQHALALAASDHRAPSSLPPLAPWTSVLSLPESTSGAIDGGGGGAGRILIMLGHPDVALVLAHCLTTAGFVTRVESSWLHGLAGARSFAPDVVLVDSRAPDFIGSTIVRRLRQIEPEDDRSAVITLIRNDADLDLSLGLESYPCDFLLIPTSARDLALRIEEIVRARRGRKVVPHPEIRRHYTVGPLELDVDRHKVRVNGEEIRFSTLEMRLLADLVEHRGHVRTRKNLLEDVWRYNTNVTTRTPDTHINRLRIKLGAAGILVETVRGTGYRLSAQFPVVTHK